MSARIVIWHSSDYVFGMCKCAEKCEIMWTGIVLMYFSQLVYQNNSVLDNEVNRALFHHSIQHYEKFSVTRTLQKTKQKATLKLNPRICQSRFIKGILKWENCLLFKMKFSLRSLTFELFTSLKYLKLYAFCVGNNKPH